MGNIQSTHVLDRTSPMGGPFLGKCRLCGADDLSSSAAFDRCDNPRSTSADDAVADVIAQPMNETTKPQPEVSTQERDEEAFRKWFKTTPYDDILDPHRDRNQALFWRGWQAALRYMRGRK